MSFLPHAANLLVTFSRWAGIFLAVGVFIVPCVGCGGLSHRVSNRMVREQPRPALSPPLGKSMVVIHRRSSSLAAGHGLYSGVWDSTNFIAEIGNLQSFAYVCEPGKHYFINRSVELVSVVEAQLLPDRTYNMWVEHGHGIGIASFKLRPVKQGDGLQRSMADWGAEHVWIKRAPTADLHQAQHISDVEGIIRDFVHGPKHDRVEYLNPEDSNDYRDLLQSKNPEVVIYTLKQLRTLSPTDPRLPDVLEKVSFCLSSQDTHVLRDSCRTFASLGSSRHAASLEPLLKHPSSGVRKDARDAVAKLQSKP